MRKTKRFRLMPLPKFLERLGACGDRVDFYRAWPAPNDDHYGEAFNAAVASQNGDLIWLSTHLGFTALEKEIISGDERWDVHTKVGTPLSLVHRLVGFTRWMELIVEKQKRMRAYDRRKRARKAAAR